MCGGWRKAGAPPPPPFTNKCRYIQSLVVAELGEEKKVKASTSATKLGVGVCQPRVG